jgi:hypothetical protein
VSLLAFKPFVQPLPVWDYWQWLLIPLCIAVSVVYKTVKCRHVRQIPREAASITLWIILAMIGVAAGVLLVYKFFVEWT